MNQKRLIMIAVIVVVALVLIGALWHFASKQPVTPAAQPISLAVPSSTSISNVSSSLPLSIVRPASPVAPVPSAGTSSSPYTVTITPVAPGSLPPTIVLGNFVLVRNGPVCGNIPTSTPTLSRLGSGYVFYPDPADTYTDPTGRSYDPTHFGNDDDVIIRAPSGALFDYLLVPQEAWAAANGTLGNLTGVFYRASDISSSALLHGSYGQIAPQSCKGTLATYVLKNLPQSDIVPIGTTEHGVALYGIANASNPLSQDEFNIKIAPWTNAGATTISMDGAMVPAPSYASYAAKNPVLLFQDPWGRWLGLGETDYKNNQCK